MSLLTEVFGEKAIYWTLERLKEEINYLPPALKERFSYLLKDWAAIRGERLTREDFDGIS